MDTLKAIAANVWKRLYHIIVAGDQLFGTLVTLGAAYPDETPSSYAWRMYVKGRPWGRITRPLIDFCALLIFGEWDHCQKSYLKERARAHVPPELRDSTPNVG